MGKIRFGIVGCGAMGNTHLPAMQAVSDIAELSSVCDIVEERAKTAQTVLGAPHMTTDYREMIGHVDAVIVVLPHHLHREVGEFFMKNGVHVLMEKPMANTEEECLSMIKTRDESGVTLMTAYPVRYWPAIVKLKELVDSGEYGDLFHMSIWTEQYTNYSADAQKSAWTGSAKTLGGGQLFSHGCHYIDILLWFLGNPVEGTHVGTNFGTPWMEREGTSNVAIRFENGALGYHMGTWGARGTDHGYCFQLHTTKGMLEYRLNQGEIRYYRNIKSDLPSIEDGKCNIEVLWKEDDKTKKTQLEMRHFFECIRDHKKPLTDAEGSLQGLRVIWKLYEAEEAGKVADLRGLGL